MIENMTQELIEAKELLEREELTCVFLKNGIFYKSCERGIKPLLSMLDNGTDLKNAVAADKIVGKGAAFLYVLLGVTEVFSKVISTPAKQTLERNGITVFFETEVEAIRNRTNTGFCPIESLVIDVDKPHVALEKIHSYFSFKKEK